MSRFRNSVLTWGLGAGLMLAASLSLRGCLGGDDGNPPRGTLSAARGREGASKGIFGVGKESHGTRSSTRAGVGKLGRRSGGR